MSVFNRMVNVKNNFKRDIDSNQVDIYVNVIGLQEVLMTSKADALWPKSHVENDTCEIRNAYRDFNGLKTYHCS